MRDFFKVLKRAVVEYIDDEPFDLSAIVAFYAIFSLPALLIIVISLVGYVFGHDAVEGEIEAQISEAIGQEAAVQVQTMIANAYEDENTKLMTIIGIAVLLFGATSVLVSLQRSLNRVWWVRTKKESTGVKKIARDRIASFGIILAIGFLLLISLLVTAGLSALGSWVRQALPTSLYYFFYVLHFVVSLTFIAVLFSLLFKFLPDVRVQWKSLWKGALFTSFLFMIGKFAMGIYFGNMDPASSYGAAGSVILILLWVNYSCLILFLGAKFTKKYAEYHHHYVEPKPHAEWSAHGFGA
ncbi:YihY/virulence factor BrkB family protein [Cytophagaceae bacterium ABcell3]|nr:YihY/virulence factor BrkB family protein [Cytophagaceae bacterium ABcell3]